MLLDVLTRVAADSGYDAVQDRTVLVRLLNSGAKELHSKLECTKIYREVTLATPQNKLVSLPSFIGELRGMRENTTDSPFNLYPLMSPRYVSTSWDWRVRNWRDVSESPVHTLPASVGVLTLAAAGLESTNAVVLINGGTSNSQVVEEEVTMDATTKVTTNSFNTDIVTIASFSNRVYNITVSDSAGNELAVLYNNESKTRYKIVDVAEVFWASDTTTQDSLIDVAYKVKPAYLSKDTDSFYAGDDYDEAWYNLCMAMYVKPLADKQADFIRYSGAALSSIISNKGTSEAAEVKKIYRGPIKFSMVNTIGGEWPAYGDYYHNYQ